MDMKRNYLSASQLGIQDWEYKALNRVRHFLAINKIPENHFDMGVGCRPLIHGRANIPHPFCETIGCIGGWMAFLEFGHHMPAREYVAQHNVRDYNGLSRLFYPTEIPPSDWTLITPAMAIRAIDNYLLTGEPEWKVVFHEGELDKNRQRPRFNMRDYIESREYR